MQIADLQKIDIYEKLIALAVCVPLMMLMTTETVYRFESFGMIYVVASYAHFTLAHLYQIRAGKVNLKRLVLYTFCAVLFYYLAINYTVAFIIATVTFGYMHILFDEAHLTRQQASGLRFTLALNLMAMIMFYTLWFFTGLAYVTYVIWALFALSIALVSYVHLIKQEPISAYEFIMLFYTFAVFAFIVSGLNINPALYFVFFAFMHYMSWYVKMYDRFGGIRSEKGRSYIWDVILINAVFLAGILYAKTLPEAHVLNRYVYHYDVAFAWIMLHNVFTLRPKDYSAVFSDYGNGLAKMFARGK